MRSADAEQPSLFSYSQTRNLYRPIIRCAGFGHWSMPLWSHTRRPGITPERLIPALLRQILSSTRSKRPLVEPLRYNMLIR